MYVIMSLEPLHGPWLVSSGEGCAGHRVALSASARDEHPLVASDGQVRERE